MHAGHALLGRNPAEMNPETPEWHSQNEKVKTNHKNEINPIIPALKRFRFPFSAN
jgi:hypothetical protein